MLKDLYDVIQHTPLIDTHEHLDTEQNFVENGPDVLQDLFEFYPASDLVSAGASTDAVNRALNGTDTDVEARWNGVKRAWEAIQFTGYGEGVRLLAKHIYGIEEITLDAIIKAQPINDKLRQPDERRRLLKDVANLDHVQIDNFTWSCLPDESDPEYFLYDLSWANFCNADVDFAQLQQETGIEVTDIASLNTAMSALFEKYGATAIAVKTQHAYQRTLKWQPAEDLQAEQVLQKQLKGESLSLEDKLTLGDYCWEQGIQLAIEHDLPVKIHTGYLAGNLNYNDPDRVRAVHFANLIMKYPDARFVLMHTAYPYSAELITLAKHFPNVYIDMCWAWSINPLAATDFVRQAIHTMPINKLFLFGGDTRWATATVAYAIQARSGFYRALNAEVSDGYLTEKQAIFIANRLIHANQRDCFNIEGTRANLRKQVSS